MHSSEYENLPQFSQWSSTFPTRREEDYISDNLSISTALVFTSIMFPEFKEVRGCIIRGSEYSEKNFEEWWRSTNGEQSSIEQVINHVHLWDIFYPEEDSEYRALETLAGYMEMTWRMSAERSFPDYQFETDVTDDYGPTILIWKHRD